jgi:hypothetical protein
MAKNLHTGPRWRPPRRIVAALLAGLAPWALAQVAPSASPAIQRPVPQGVAVISELKAAKGPILLTPDSREDRIDVVTGKAKMPEIMRANAFGYGPSAGRKERCLLVSVGPGAKTSGWKQWMLCGASPILALRPDAGQDPGNYTVEFLPHRSAMRTLPAELRGALRAGVVVLPTEAGDSVLFMGKDGPVWKELPGQE